MKARIPVDEQHIAEFCRRHHVRKFALYGSVIHSDFGPTSDVDVLIDFEPYQGPGLIGMAGMEYELSDMFGGRRVDLVTPSGLSRYIRDRVLADAEVVYGS